MFSVFPGLSNNDALGLELKSANDATQNPLFHLPFKLVYFTMQTGKF